VHTKLIASLFLAVSLTACSAQRYTKFKVVSYVPPTPTRIQKEKSYNTEYNKAWKAAVAVFAFNNFQIKTMDKDAGLIAAEGFYNPSDSLSMIHPGTTVKRAGVRVEHMRPSGFAGCANPAYVRQHGKVVKKEVRQKVYKQRSTYPVTALLNLFLTQSTPATITIRVNTKFQTRERIGDVIPSPVSNGTLEKGIFEFLDAKLE